MAVKGSDDRPGARSVVVLDLPGGRIELAPERVVELRDRAAARAGRSSAARDLSLLLDRALRQASLVALRRGEAATLARIAAAVDIGAAVADPASEGR
jgi:hypothetical protein